MLLEWYVNKEYLYASTKYFKFRNKLIMLDLDNTLITVKSGKKFPIDENDWKWLYDNVKSTLQTYYNNDYCIIIMSNQGGINKGIQSADSWMKKLNTIINEIDFDIRVFCSTGHNKYRKPFPTFFDEFIPYDIRSSLDYKNSFFCGDAAGRKGDFNDTDYKFAYNCMLNFKTPEEFFLGENVVIPKIKYEFPKITSELEYEIKFKEKDMIIMVGYPGSGKSFVSKDLNNKLKYEIVNQDILKTKQKCINLAEKLMILNKSLIIDCTNPDILSRKNWIDLAKKYNYNIKVIQMTTNLAISNHNNHYRFYKTGRELVPEIAYRFFKSKYQEPKLEEGINEIIKINCGIPNDPFYYYYYC